MVPPNVNGEPAEKVRYGCSLEFERSLSVYDPLRTRAVALRREFEAAQPVGR